MIPFQSPMPLDARTLSKLARAADPEVSSLNVYADADGELFIWGLVDQEPRHGDRITFDTDTAAQRPGLFQATIGGTGNVTVYRNAALLGNLSHNVLVETYYDVLWAGPVHAVLAGHLHAYVAGHRPELAEGCGLGRHATDRERAALAVAELALAGPGQRAALPARGRVDHRPASLLRQPADQLRDVLRSPDAGGGGPGPRPFCPHPRHGPAVSLMAGDGGSPRPEDLVFLRDVFNELEQRKNEVLGASRFIASLSCVDGVVLLDQCMAVHGFGVELRTDNDLGDVYMAGDVEAHPYRRRKVELTHFGTRHRAMMRYCHHYPGTLGFAVSQDGDIQAMTRIGDKLILWENIDVQLAFRPEDWQADGPKAAPVLRPLNVRT